MFRTLVNAFKDKGVRKKIIITVLLLIVYRIGCFIPVPGIDSEVFSSTIEGYSFLNILSSVSGGALASGTLFAMGISPYINSSIIMQLLTVGIPRLERLSKEGEEGRKKIAQYTRYLTILLAVVQALGILLNFGDNGAINFGVLGSTFGPNNKWLVYTYMVIIYSAGASLTMWLGERITEYGVGNGISLLIFVGIISTLGGAVVGEIGDLKDSFQPLWNLLAFAVVAVIIFGLIVYVDLAERKVPVQYAKQVKGRKMYGGQSTSIPIRINASGVMPLIFAFSIISFPSMILEMFWPNWSGTAWYAEHLGTESWIYYIVLPLLILFFAFFYAQIQFNPEDVSKNIQQYGGFIPGIRPGKPTAQHLKKISNRITLFGAIFLALLALIPTLIFKAVIGDATSGLLNALSTTGLLIIVSVALELDKQLQSQLMMKQYKGFLK